MFTILVTIIYITGFLCAASAILKSRTPQGATAWFISLITIPFISVPFFFIFGGPKFYGYANRRRKFDRFMSQKIFVMKETFLLDGNNHIEFKKIVNTLATFARPGFTSHNKIKLLIDANQTYFSMLYDLEKAEHYIFFQFYVFRPDLIGHRFLEVLMRKSQSGVRVNFLYDEIGTALPKNILDQMKRSGINVCHFNSMGGRGRFQVNFRNHRKIVIIDGKIAFVGGLNIGDDYLGHRADLGHWRDTHVRLEGPAVLVCQMTHAKDWYWSTQKDLEASWEMASNEGNANILVLPTGPSDEKHACLLAHLAIVNAAQKRLWIANPYLVPPESLMDAILLAAHRGVDVRIITPSTSDAWIVGIASQVYISKLLEHGVKVYRYKRGFLHQKVLLVDDLFAVVGSANFDFRSMFINFEISVLAQEEEFILDIERMLIKDMDMSEIILAEEFLNLSLWKKITGRAANLLAPVL